MTEPQLTFTPAQQALIDGQTSIYIDACPGAGKTQAIVQRFINRAGSEPRRGVGLISFTNAAIDEARSRSGSNAALLRVPNFVGTIDSFINRFFVAPVFRSRKGLAPTFRDNWSTVPGTTAQANGGLQAPLDWFAFDHFGTATLHIRRVPWTARQWLSGQEPRRIEALERAASRLWLDQVNRGVLDAAASRVLLTQYLQMDYRDHFIALMQARFSEIIVDEVQDCSREDVAVLNLLLDAGVRLVMVGDPDQAIYGFRNDTVDTELGALLARVPRGTRLDGNFRSSPAICRAVDSLRHAGGTDVPIGTHRTVTHPVHILSYTDVQDARHRIGHVLEQLHFDRNETIVLAHHTDKARSFAGAPPPMNPKSHKLVWLAVLIDQIQDQHSSGPERAQALRSLERRLRELCPEDLPTLRMDAYLDDRQLTASQFRERCLRLAMGSVPPFSCTPSEFKAHLASQTDSQRVLGWSLKGVNRPPGNAWPTLPTRSVAKFEYSTVHGYKGLQAPAVILVIPKPSKAQEEIGVQQWCADEPGEARRVLYVGASRAQQLLIIAAHESVHDSVATKLKDDGVAIQLLA